MAGVDAAYIAAWLLPLFVGGGVWTLLRGSARGPADIAAAAGAGWLVGVLIAAACARFAASADTAHAFARAWPWCAAIGVAAWIAAAVRLRGQGGLAAIDFVSMRQNDSRKAVELAAKSAGADDPWGPIFAPMSRFGIVELSRAQYMRPLRDVLLDADGRKSVETVALEALRASAAFPLAEGLEAERRAYEACLVSEDRKEALAAFAAKRKPVFSGR